jgi:hypothetical protein
MTGRRRRLHDAVAEERGSVLVVAGLIVVVVAMLGTVIVEVGQTMSHRRHLQVQADAAALAAAQEFPLCATNPSSAYNSMAAIADQYGGFGGPTSFNQQAGSASGYAGNVGRTYQSPDYPAAPSGYSQHAAENDPIFLNSDGSPNTDTTTLTCGNGTGSSTKMFDVKASEYGIHGVFSFGISSTVNAHARVELKAVNEATGLLPLAVPDVRPKFIFATFIDESTGAPITGCPDNCEEELKCQGCSDEESGGGSNQETWAPDPDTELAVPVSTTNIGVRIRFIGADDPTLQCGELYTQCYDATSANGLVHIRGWQPGPAPIAQDVWLQSGTCVPDAYFAQGTCDANVAAMIDLNTDIKQTNADPSVWATVDGANQKYPLMPTATGTGPIEWDGSVHIDGDGPHAVELFYGSGKGTSLGVVQRAYIANPSGSGPLNWVQVYQKIGGVMKPLANSFKVGTTPSLGVTVKTIGKLLISQPSDPPIYLRVFNDSGSASQNQSLNCEPQGSPNNNLKDQIANGCTPWFKTQSALTCPANTWNGIQALPQPWTCVGINTGASIGQVWQGLNQRIYKDANAPSSACASEPVNWIRPDPANGIIGGFDQTEHPNDRRVLPLFVTPLGTFEGTGGGVVPLIDFGYFYVTGYKNDPCEGTANQDPVPNNRGAYIRGHFIKYFPIDAQHHPSDDNCDFSTITPCVGVLTR